MMGSKIWLMFFVLALAMALVSGLSRIGSGDGTSTGSCIGLQCGINVEYVTETRNDSEANHLRLAGKRRHHGHATLKRNIIPCLRHGHSYYNCRSKVTRANPYKRACTAIAYCNSG
ncbi:hypothetical protein V6N13_143736 [Hibiscus sabdariffa]|uniref:Uncharacterized protein n=1 Tax=Hibiscus sabdariffa TaxID=183260 RepID=A0ABR2FII1_9ROSI